MHMDDTPKLRYVNPDKRRGRLYLAVPRLSATKAGAWIAVNVSWKLDPYLLKLTRGRSARRGHSQLLGHLRVETSPTERLSAGQI
jgi:hypothetical protein